MNLFKKPAPEDDPEPKADDTTPGVRMLKDMWQIDAGKKPREKIDRGSVSSDIYNLRPSHGVPHRRHGRSSND